MTHDSCSWSQSARYWETARLWSGSARLGSARFPRVFPRSKPRLDETRRGYALTCVCVYVRTVTLLSSVSRIPKDEPIPRFIGLFAYMLQGYERQMTTMNPGQLVFRCTPRSASCSCSLLREKHREKHRNRLRSDNESAWCHFLSCDRLSMTLNDCNGLWYKQDMY